MITRSPAIVLAALFLAAVRHAAALDTTAWRYEQSFTIPTAGLARLEVPVETLHASQPTLQDVRLLSPAGVETPLIVETTPLSPDFHRRASRFTARATGTTTVLEMDTSTTETVSAILLESPSPEFVKSVRIESGTDQAWQELASGEVIFRQPDGAARLRLPIPPAAYSRLRLTIDDQRSAPVPFTGASLDLLPTHSERTISHAITITKIAQEKNATILSLDPGGGNLRLSRLRFQISDPVFSRRVQLDFPHTETVRAAPAATGILCRLPDTNGLRAESVELNTSGQVFPEHATLTIENGDSPPLHVTGISAERQPVTLIFHATEAGEWKLLTGHRTASAPQYDITALEAGLRSRAAAAATAGPLTANASYQEPPALPGIPAEGARIDLSAWRFRKPVSAATPGIIRIELDDELLAHCHEALADLRLVQSGRQIPWLLSPSDESRAVEPVVTPMPDPARPASSIWQLTLPQAGLPLRTLVCTSSTPVFSRTLRLHYAEKFPSGRTRRTDLGYAQWTRSNPEQSAEYSLDLLPARVPGAVFLEIENGDNPPIALTGLKFLRPARFITAKLADPAPAFLYYGNAAAAAPSYDLQLVRRELLAALPVVAQLGAGETLRETLAPPQGASAGSPWLWIAMGIVVAVLLWIVSRLLPQQPDKEHNDTTA